MGVSAPWPESHLSTLRREWSNGLSATQIAPLVQRTRSAVCGMVFRLGLTRAPGSPRIDPNSIAKIARKRSCVRRERHPRFIAPKFNKERVMERPALVEPLQIPFLEREAGQCRAITDATPFAQRCCGHPADSAGIYCAAHVAIFYTPSKARGR